MIVQILQVYPNQLILLKKQQYGDKVSSIYGHEPAIMLKYFTLVFCSITE